MKSPLAPMLVLCGIAAFAGCNKEPAHDHAAHAKHVHTAPHGGTLVELGEHAYSLEFVRDAAAGKLSAYVLDAHAENFIRVKISSFEVVATVGGEKRTLKFSAVANPATGETVGDTSQFDTEVEWLKSVATFDAQVTVIEVRGNRFPEVKFNFPKGSAPD